ncbi:alpha/beta hydrolase [Streptomyces sp. NPDC001928]|uniref:alpha/beta fold hydrolase n=1 Tax=Streptomyces sp. NPDC001928 TaxID=3154404 RepID=UPI0033196B34
MIRKVKAAAVATVFCTLFGAGLVGCEGDSEANREPASTNAPTPEADLITGTKKIDVGGKWVNVSCSGDTANGKPVIVLLHGGGDGLDKVAAIQKTLSQQNRVCSYDRLGAGASDKPDGPQDFSSSEKVLTGVLDRIAGAGPVVLAGHSLGGVFAARYAPDHGDRVKGLVLLDATPPTMAADITNTIPASAKGPAAEVRAQNLAIFQGQNPEKLVIADGPVRSVGNIPVEVIKHGRQDLAAIPTYGPRLEEAWSAGQRKWLALSSRSSLSTAEKSGHYIYVDQPDAAVQAIERVTSQVAGQANGG